MKSARCALWRGLGAALFIVALAGPLLAEDVLRFREIVDFDRPEAWAMKYYGVATLFTGLMPPESVRPWSLDAGVEGVSLPHLSAAKRTVGFTGTKAEDLNKLPGYVRPRLTLGLPSDFSVTVGWVPPVTIRGLRANLYALSVERPLIVRASFSLGARAYGQRGYVRSDFTCPEEEVAFPVGSPQNLYGCQAPSGDVATLRQSGLELIGSRSFRTLGAPTVSLGAAGTYLDADFQVNAETYGFLDRTHLFTHGIVYTFEGGVVWPVMPRVDAGLQLFYAPLSVLRPGDTATRNDSLLNVRILLTYRLR
ncbi:MAG: hypothetical protein ABI718_02365 [Acidobacteriota bacterium]